MQRDEPRHRSRWMMRAMEWDDAKARYPNIWVDGMPRQLLVLERVAGRLRLGDLIAVYSPASTRHPERSERFVGLVRVSGLRRADAADQAWIEVETAHRLEPPLDLARPPRRVFMCCDPGWPEPDVALFREVFDAALAAGWQPGRGESEPAPKPPPAPQEDARQAVEPKPDADPAQSASTETPASESGPSASERSALTVSLVPSGDHRVFAGSCYSGDMRDPRDRTWLAVVALEGQRLQVARLEPTGRSGLQSSLRNPDTTLMRAEAIGLGFPFGLPVAFAESVLDGPFPEEGWWALARRLERAKRPEFLMALEEFRGQAGEVRRLTDEWAPSPSPLHRSDADLGSRSFHGIRMIAEDRSRYAIRPFESAQGRRLLEVCPEAALRRLVAGGSSAETADVTLADLLHRVEAAGRWPVDVPARFRKACLQSRSALDAVVAARCAALAVLSDEADRAPEDLAPGHGEQVRREGWIYGLDGPA